MQKLIGIISGKNNKSCKILHHESNKIGFAFLWFFYDFLRNLQESATSQILFELPFAERPSERFAALQCGPWGRPAGAGCSIPASLPPGLAGEGQAGDLGGTMVRFVGWKEARNGRLGGSTGGHWRRPPRLVMPATWISGCGFWVGGKLQWI
jgi:hypothetical protein